MIQNVKMRLELKNKMTSSLRIVLKVTILKPIQLIDCTNVVSLLSRCRSIVTYSYLAILVGSVLM